MSAQSAFGTFAVDTRSTVRDETFVRSLDLKRTFQIALAVIWLLDAMLQFQSFMFVKGSGGFSGMLNGLAAGNPGWIARTITWNASIIYHHPVATNTAFALIQVLIALGIAWPRTLKWALGLSIIWALGVWWFGEGLGAVFTGSGTPFGGGPGAVLIYGLIAILLWPRETAATSLPVAYRAIGAGTAKIVWMVVWVLSAVLALVGSGMTNTALSGIVDTMNSGEPGWLSAIDRHFAPVLLHHGAVFAIALGVFCVIMASAVFLPSAYEKALIVAAVVVWALIWVCFENFGGILAGGATDPNSGPLIILFVLIYWPLRASVQGSTDTADISTTTQGVTA